MVAGLRPEGSAQQLEARRNPAVSLLKQGYSYPAVARIVRSSLSSLVRWRQAFRRGGKRGLKPRPTPGRTPRMNAPQKRPWVVWLKGGARAAGYPTELWTAPRVAEQIRRRWRIAYHPGHVWKILIGLNWSGQKPERRAIQRKPRKIRRWKQREWPRIKKTERLGAHLIFLDESGFLLIPPVQRTWAPVGQTPGLRHSYRRERLSVIGGLSVSPRRQRLGVYFQIYPWNGRAVDVVEYFGEWLRHLRGEGVALLAGGSIHRDRKVKEFCRRHRRLPWERFPAYAPELNPEEYVWTQTKHQVSNACVENRDQLLDLVVDGLCDVKESPSRLAACLSQAAKHGLVWNN